LRTGRFKTFENSRFEEDSLLLQWDYGASGKPKISEAYHTDVGDAVLYAWRECRHFLYEAEEVSPKIGTDSYMDMLEEMEAKKLEDKLKKQKEDEDGIVGWSDEVDPYSDDF
jgi:hypothetical protein